MSKRYTDNQKFRDPWYRSLSPVLKCLWEYVCAECDEIGVWEIDRQMAEFSIGSEIDWNEAEELLSKPRSDGHPRMKVIANGTHWFITGYAVFQWKHLLANPSHKDDRGIGRKIAHLLDKYSLWDDPSIAYAIGHKNKNKKEKEKKKQGGSGGKTQRQDWSVIDAQFEDWCKAYAKGVDKAKAKVKWRTLNDPERSACLSVVGRYVLANPDRQYRKNMLTYLNGMCWEDEIQDPDALPSKDMDMLREIAKGDENERGRDF